MHPDLEAGACQGQTIGISCQIVTGAQKKVNIEYGANPDERYPGPMPIPSNALIEGYPNPGTGDRHVLVLDKDGCWLYELDNPFLQKNGNWKADSSAVWDMMLNGERPLHVDLGGCCGFVPISGTCSL